jgi:hypothetical protein
MVGAQMGNANGIYAVTDPGLRRRKQAWNY